MNKYDVILYVLSALIGGMVVLFIQTLINLF
jgi:hypothetical protein